MFKDVHVFNSFSVNDIAKAKEFYGQTLGLKVSDIPEMGLLKLQFANGGEVMIYPKDNHVAATFTVLNFPVDDVEQCVDDLVKQGISFEKYDGFNQDNKGIASDEGQKIAWFKDPAGNILSVLEIK